MAGHSIWGSPAEARETARSKVAVMHARSAKRNSAVGRGLDSLAIILQVMPLFRSRLPIITVEPCLPSSAKAPPTGPDWIHEIKHDGFRIMRNGAGRGALDVAQRPVPLHSGRRIISAPWWNWLRC
jgi:hypothetical protein